MGGDGCAPCGCFAGFFKRKLQKEESRNLYTSAIRTQLQQEMKEETPVSLQALLLQNDPAEPISRQYEIKYHSLGSGGFGTVYKAKHKATGDIRAVKVVKKERIARDIDMLRIELTTLLTLDHPNVLKLYSFFEDKDSIYIVTELCTGGELMEALADGRFNEEDEIRRVLRDLVRAVSYCHARRIVHRDLKLENLLFKDTTGTSQLKVIDFGLAAIKASSEEGGPWLSAMLGTLSYVAPEVIDKEKKYDEKCDMWSIGVIMYVLFTGEHPFFTKECKKEKRELWRRILKEPPLKEPLQNTDPPVPLDARSLIIRLLQKDPTRRPSAAEVLADPWFASAESAQPSHVAKEKSRPKQTLSGVNSYSRTTRFERAVLMIAAHNALETEVKQLRKVFTKLDKSCTGTLSKAEIAEGLRSIGVSADDALFEALDADGTGQVSYTEFLAACIEPSTVASSRAAAAAFKFFDLDGDGKISLDELSQVIGAEAAEIAMQKTDKDGDGSITLKEFQARMEKIAEKRGNAPCTPGVKVSLGVISS